MKLKNNLFVILAIFCVIFSASAVCAADHADLGDAQILDASEDGHNGAIIPADAGHDEQAMLNATHAAGGDVDNQTNPINQTNTTNSTNTTNATNTTHAAGGVAENQTNGTAQNPTHATGNPILALLTVSAVLGGVAVIKRK